MSSESLSGTAGPLSVAASQAGRLVARSDVTAAARRRPDALLREELLARIGNFAADRYGYVVPLTLRSLARYYQEPAVRAHYQVAECVLTGSRWTRLLMYLLHGIRLPVITAPQIQAHLLAVARPDERIVIVASHAADARRMAARCGTTNFRCYAPPTACLSGWALAHESVNFIERFSPFRFCLLALDSPHREVIARELRMRGTAKGLLLCIDSRNINTR